jgi:hypothetical protein
MQSKIGLKSKLIPENEMAAATKMIEYSVEDYLQQGIFGIVQ